ncbi:hypothetical protein BCR43DRAFT_486331 [Syncephalastrum racemosum]|uniref:Uncharacterized protein n=1 Tax=Syncephalastrum racemosum TaxID=13706 RepID=A0A1X2HNU2_SYNRA|nr:hypothetical protein BCR43DRAFT_486331 [Syncephalastrum racemosum]
MLSYAADPNHRHITVPSINPGQRVWIRVHPTDTGKTLAQRIHIIATYKSRKITRIVTANDREIPLDDTAVFEDWNEIEKLQDGDPWKVEWGPLDHSFLGGELNKSAHGILLTSHYFIPMQAVSFSSR